MFALYYPVRLSMSFAPLGPRYSLENGLPESERVEPVDAWL